MAPPKPTASIFSPTQSSFFKSSPTQSQSQQKSSFFTLPGSLPTESLKADLFGIFKAPEPPKPAMREQPSSILTPHSSVKDVKPAISVENVSEVMPRSAKSSSPQPGGADQNQTVPPANTLAEVIPTVSKIVCGKDIEVSQSPEETDRSLSVTTIEASQCTEATEMVRKFPP